MKHLQRTKWTADIELDNKPVKKTTFIDNINVKLNLKITAHSSIIKQTCSKWKPKENVFTLKLFSLSSTVFLLIRSLESLSTERPG